MDLPLILQFDSRLVPKGFPVCRGVVLSLYYAFAMLLYVHIQHSSHFWSWKPLGIIIATIFWIQSFFVRVNMEKELMGFDFIFFMGHNLHLRFHVCVFIYMYTTFFIFHVFYSNLEFYYSLVGFLRWAIITLGPFCHLSPLRCSQIVWGLEKEKEKGYYNT